MNKQFVMMSGLPRSGSSVLGSLLNQHPLIHASTTSPVIDLITIINDSWHNISAALADRHQDQYGNIINGMIAGAYHHIDKPIIVDKNRLWPRHGKLMTDVLGDKPKIICTVRSIPEILSSYILLINKNSDKITFVDQDLINNNLSINNKNRCRILWEKYINHPYTSFRMGYNSPDIDMCIVEYDDIVNDSQATLNKICEFIGIESYQVDINNMQSMSENDDYHGGMNGLHDVRSVMKRISPPPEQVIGKELTKLYTDMKLDFWNKS
jgi:sulfotransferase